MKKMASVLEVSSFATYLLIALTALHAPWVYASQGVSPKAALDVAAVLVAFGMLLLAIRLVVTNRTAKATQP